MSGIDVEDIVDTCIERVADEALRETCARRGIDIARLDDLGEDDIALVSDRLARGQRDDALLVLERLLPAPRAFEGRA